MSLRSLPGCGRLHFDRAPWLDGRGRTGVHVRPAHCTVKAEYLYYDRGSVTYAVPAIVQTTATGTPFFGATSASHVAFTGNVAHAGVNFGF